METPSPPSPAELEALVAAHLERHRRRIAGMHQIKKTEEALQQALQQALRPIETPSSPGWLQFLARLGLVALDPPPPPVAEQLWDRHELALEKVRGLGHHLHTLDRELVLLEQDISAAEAKRSASAQARGRAAAEVTTQQARGADAWTAAQAETRWAAVEARWTSLLSMHQEVRAVLRNQVSELGSLYRQSSQSLDSLGRQITGMAADLAMRSDEQHMAVLRQRLGELALVAETSEVSLSRNLDALTVRLRRLDAEAARRAEALAEVEQSLAQRRR